MKFNVSVIKRATISTVAIGALASIALLVGAGSASAATDGAGQFSLCSYGNYASYVEFPDRGNFSTFVVNSGQCTSLNNLGTSKNTETIKIFGVSNSGTTFSVQDASYRPSLGGEVITYGTESKHWALIPSV